MKQNVRKNGRPFIIPDKIIEILARISAVFNASFRPLESYMRIFKEILGIPRIYYSSILRRIRKIKVSEIMNASSSVEIDSTGFKTTIRGDWMSNKWAKKRRGRIKLHVSADTERIMASRISLTAEHSHDATIPLRQNFSTLSRASPLRGKGKGNRLIIFFVNCSEFTKNNT
jgi:hypothetical protein